MSNNNNNRLDRIEKIIEQNEIRHERLLLQQERLLLQQESNNKRTVAIERAIEAMLEQRATDQLKHEARMARLEENLIETKQIMAKIAETQSGLTKILINHDEDRPTILRRLMKIENKVDQLLEHNQD